LNNKISHNVQDSTTTVGLTTWGGVEENQGEVKNEDSTSTISAVPTTTTTTTIPPPPPPPPSTTEFSTPRVDDEVKEMVPETRETEEISTGQFSPRNRRLS